MKIYIKKLSLLTITILIIGIFFIGCVENQNVNQDNNKENDLTEQNYNSNTIIVGKSIESNFTIIQDAIDYASDNDVIFVESGIYQETILINKSIHLIGENQNDTVLLSEAAIKIEIIDGKEVIKEKDRINILSINASNCTVKNFTFKTNEKYKITQGIVINSGKNTIMNCNVSGFYNAIELFQNSGNNSISKNIVSNNNIGIEGFATENNNISDNYLFNNTQQGIYFFTKSDNNIFSKNIFFDNKQALRVKGSDNNLIFYNYFNNNSYGVYLCCGANYNIVYKNTFIRNILGNAYEGNSLLNYWHSDSLMLGNYWYDYKGVDENGDGIGDSNYTIIGSGKNDNYPLIDPVDVDYFFKEKIID